MADTFVVELTIDPSGAVSGMQNFANASESAGQAARRMAGEVRSGAESANETATHLMEKLRELAVVVGVAFTAEKVIEFGKAAMEAAHHYEAILAVMEVLGKAGGYTSEQLAAAQGEIEKNNVSMEDARAATLRLVAAHIDLSKAGELSAAAQNVSAITGKDFLASENALALAVQTGMDRELKRAGIKLNLAHVVAEYAQQNMVEVSTISQSTLEHIRLDAVLEALQGKQGAFAAKLATTEGQLGEVKRALSNVKLMLGEALGEGALSLVEGLSGKLANLVKWMQENHDAMVEMRDGAILLIEVIGATGLTLTLARLGEAFLVAGTYSVEGMAAMAAAMAPLVAVAAVLGAAIFAINKLTDADNALIDAEDRESAAKLKQFMATNTHLKSLHEAAPATSAVKAETDMLSSSMMTATLKFKEHIPVLLAHTMGQMAVAAAYAASGPVVGAETERIAKNTEENAKAVATLAPAIRAKALAMLAADQHSAALVEESKAYATLKISASESAQTLQDSGAAIAVAIKAQGESEIDISAAIAREAESVKINTDAKAASLKAETSTLAALLPAKLASIEADRKAAQANLVLKNTYDDLKAVVLVGTQNTKDALVNTQALATAQLAASDPLQRYLGVTEQLTNAQARLVIVQKEQTDTLAANRSLMGQALDDRLKQIQANRDAADTLQTMSERLSHEATLYAPIKAAIDASEQAFGQFFSNVLTGGQNAFTALGNALKQAIMNALSSEVVIYLQKQLHAAFAPPAVAAGEIPSPGVGGAASLTGSASATVFVGVLLTVAQSIADTATQNAEAARQFADANLKWQQSFHDLITGFTATGFEKAKQALAAQFQGLMDKAISDAATAIKNSPAAKYGSTGVGMFGSTTGTVPSAGTISQLDAYIETLKKAQGTGKNVAQDRELATLLAQMEQLDAAYKVQSAALDVLNAKQVEVAERDLAIRNLVADGQTVAAASAAKLAADLKEVAAAESQYGKDSQYVTDLKHTQAAEEKKLADDQAKAAADLARVEIRSQDDAHLRALAAANDPTYAAKARRLQEMREIEDLVAKGASAVTIELTKQAQAAEDAAAATRAVNLSLAEMESLAVRDLRATGHGAEADQRAFDDTQAAELQAAIDAHKSDAYIAALRKTLADEKKTHDDAAAVTAAGGATAAAVSGSATRTTSTSVSSTALTSASYEQAAGMNSLLVSANIWLSRIAFATELMAGGGQAGASTVGAVANGVSSDPNAALGRSVTYARAAAGTARVS